jgi:NAD(P) transhydrogenase
MNTANGLALSKRHQAASVDRKRSVMRYDLVVIGSSPAGQEGALAAAKLNKRVAVIEHSRLGPGGVRVHSGTIPFKTIREAILYLTGFRQRDVFGECYRDKRKITMHDLNRQVAHVIDHEIDVIHDQLDRNGIDLYRGDARFVGPHEIVVQGENETLRLEAGHMLVACGTRPARPANFLFDSKHVFDSDEILQLETIPRSMIVVGGGVIGLEYASMFARLGVRVTVVDGRERVLEFCDREIVDTLLFHGRSLGMVFRLGEDVIGMDKITGDRVALQLESGKRLISDSVLFTAGRVGDTDELNLPAAGLEPDERGRLWCDENHRTWVPHIYGVGDVVGFPALASTSMEQGRRAICHAFGLAFQGCQHMPCGLDTIPEISMVGKNEEQLTKAHIPYEVGIARFSDIARGQVVGDKMGLLKLLFHRATRKLLGVHCIGETATEIVHIGQSVMAFDGTIDCFRDTVFNYPTMAECYKVAAFDGLSKLDLDECCDPADELEVEVARDAVELRETTTETVAV